MSEARNLSFSEIQKRIKEMDAERIELEAALQAKRGEEIKVLADACAKKLQAGGFSIAEGIKALEPYDSAKIKRSGIAPRPPREVVTGTTYKNPGTGETWKAGAKGRVVCLLRRHRHSHNGDFIVARCYGVGDVMRHVHCAP